MSNLDISEASVKPYEKRELAPCPFCGYKAGEDCGYDVYGETYARVYCKGCGAFGPHAETLEDARFLWNKTRYRGV